MFHDKRSENAIAKQQCKILMHTQSFATSRFKFMGFVKQNHRESYKVPKKIMHTIATLMFPCTYTIYFDICTDTYNGTCIIMHLSALLHAVYTYVRK